MEIGDGTITVGSSGGNGDVGPVVEDNVCRTGDGRRWGLIPGHGLVACEFQVEANVLNWWELPGVLQRPARWYRQAAATIEGVGDVEVFDGERSNGLKV